MKVKNHKILFSNGKAVPFVPTPNKSARNLQGDRPKYVVLHYTAGGSAQSAIDVFKNPAHKASAHIVIGHNGAVVQMGKLNEKLWHAGKSKWGEDVGLNSSSIGIEIVNWGWLKGDTGAWRSWTGQSIQDDRVVKAAHSFDGVTRGWERFDAPQVTACAEVVCAIAQTYGLGPEQILGHDDVSPGRKQDPGPAWDMAGFRDIVFGGGMTETKGHKPSSQSRIGRSARNFGAIFRRFARQPRQ